MNEPPAEKRPPGRPRKPDALDAGARKAQQRERDRVLLEKALKNPANAPERVLLTLIGQVQTHPKGAKEAWKEIGRRNNWLTLFDG